MQKKKKILWLLMWCLLFCVSLHLPHDVIATFLCVTKKIHAWLSKILFQRRKTKSHHEFHKTQASISDNACFLLLCDCCCITILNILNWHNNKTDMFWKISIFRKVGKLNFNQNPKSFFLCFYTKSNTSYS